MQFHRVEPHLHAMTFGAGWNLVIGRKQRQLAVPPAAPSSKASISWHQASRWPSLISPRYSTCR
jgi:hypothetical protein